MGNIRQLIYRYRLSFFITAISLCMINIFMGSVCLSVILFGIPCPACGITRAAELMLTGHFRESLHMHPLLIMVIAGFILYPLIKRTMRNYKLLFNVYFIITLIAFICLWLYRMKYYFPEAEPMIYHKDNLFANICEAVRIIKH